MTNEARIFLIIKEGDYRSIRSIAERLDMRIDDVLDVVYASPLFWVVHGFGNWKFKNPKNYLVKRAK
jgi:hypothetical protein